MVVLVVRRVSAVIGGVLLMLSEDGGRGGRRGRGNIYDKGSTGMRRRCTIISRLRRVVGLLCRRIGRLCRRVCWLCRRVCRLCWRVCRLRRMVGRRCGWRGCGDSCRGRRFIDGSWLRGRRGSWRVKFLAWDGGKDLGRRGGRSRKSCWHRNSIYLAATIFEEIAGR